MTDKRAVCIVRDPNLRKTLRRSLRATGTLVEFHDEPPSSTGSAPVLYFIDSETGCQANLDALRKAVSDGGRLVLMGASVDDSEVVRMMRDHEINHVIGPPVVDEAELVATSVKLLSGDIFGLDKYLSWGSLVRELIVTSYDDKRSAIERVTDEARSVGARRMLASRIANVADELLMNALYKAPRDNPDYEQKPRIIDDSVRATFRFGCDGRFFGVSVTDPFGRLSKESILESFARARASGGEPRTAGEAGAGLGLYLVLSSCTRFIANIDPGVQTEIVCLFDLRRPLEHPVASSVHVFKT